MYKLVVFLAVVAACAAAPRPQLLVSSPVVVPAVTSYSSYSSSVVHPPTVPVVHTSVVHAAPVAPVIPLTYNAPAAYYF